MKTISRISKISRISRIGQIIRITRTTRIMRVTETGLTVPKQVGPKIRMVVRPRLRMSGGLPRIRKRNQK